MATASTTRLNLEINSPVVRVTLNNPPLNIIDLPTMLELQQALAEIDLRFATNEEGARLEKKILGLRPFDDRIQLIVQGGVNRPPMERSEKVLALYEQARSIAAALDYELGEAQVGGASDGNFAAAAGAAVLDGLGIDGDGAHAVHEHILIDDIARRGALLAGLISTL